MHADHRHRLRRAAAVDEVELDHRLPLVRVALGAGLHARLAADAAAGIDEERLVGHHGRSIAGAYCCGSSRPAYSGGPSALPHADGADLVLGDLGDRVLGGDGQPVDALPPGPVVGDEHRVRADRATTWHRSVRLPARDSDRHPVAVVDRQLAGEARVQLQQRLRVLVDQRTDPPRLGAREELADHPPGGQHDRVRRRPRPRSAASTRIDVEARLAVREVERPRPRATGFHEPGSKRRGVPGGRSARRPLASGRARTPHLALDLLVGDPRVVGHAAPAGDAAAPRRSPAG